MYRRIFISGVFAGLAALALAAGAPAAALAPFDPPGFDRAIEIQEANTDRLFEIEGVAGTGVDFDARGRVAIVIMTEDLGVGGLPEQLGGIPVVVKVTGKFRAGHHRTGHDGGPGGGDSGGDSTIDPTSRFDRPVPIGVSTGNSTSCSAGTIGARVIDAGGTVYALSNNHVYALEGNVDLDSPISQPGLFDTDCGKVEGNEIGILDSYVDLFFDGKDNTVDAAIVSSTTAKLGNATPADGYGIPNSTIRIDPPIGLAVQKYGRTTGLTTGTIGAVNVIVDVGYSSGIARFVDQIIVESRRGGFLLSGDPGSLLVTRNGAAKPVGLLFASGRGGAIAIANPIDLVLDSFFVTIDGRDSQ